MKRGHSGYTFIELVVAMSIAGILAAITIPTFVSSIRSNYGVSDANSMLSLVTLARNTAISRDGYTVLCINTSATTPACSTGSVTWDQGVLLFIDTNNNGTYDSGTDILVRVEVPFTSGSNITYTAASTSTALTTIGFTGLGQMNSTTTYGHFDVKPSNSTTGERYVVVRQIGRANVCPPTDSNCGP